MVGADGVKEPLSGSRDKELPVEGSALRDRLEEVMKILKQPLHDYTKKTVGEAVLDNLEYCLRHNTSQAALEADFLKSAAICPDGHNMPSPLEFRKLLRDLGIEYETFATCEEGHVEGRKGEGMPSCFLKIFLLWFINSVNHTAKHTN